jgi:hypothetical protein
MKIRLYMAQSFEYYLFISRKGNTLAHRKGHTSPAWSLQGYPDIPDEPCHWELFLITEGIEAKDFENNPKVLDFIVKHARTYYVPTEVLKMWGMDEDF